MNKLRVTINAFALIAGLLVLTASARAQQSRTWVSGTGDDVNACSRTAPCKTFAKAISVTAINGEINCLNVGSYGAVNINKSITIDCEDTQGTIQVTGGDGVFINLGAPTPNDPLRIVRVRGLTINGMKVGTRGIHVSNTNTAPVTVHVEQVVVDSVVNEGLFFNAAGGELLVRNSLFQNCGTVGVHIDSNAVNGIVHATLEDSSFVHNEQGIRAETFARMSVSRCNLSNNSLNGVVVFTVDAGQSEINLYKCMIASNRQFGVVSIVVGGAAPAIIRLDDTHIVNNIGVVGGAGVHMQTGGQVLSRGNNTISGNTVDVQGGTLGSLTNF